MMRSNSLMLLMALLAGSAVACSSEGGGGGGGGGTDAGNTPTDMGSTPTDSGSTPTDSGSTPTDSGSTPTDSGMMRTDGGGGGTDASTGPVDAGPPYDPCAMGAVVDFPRMGTTSRITGNNSMVGGLNAIRTTCGGSPGHQVVFRYVPGTTSRLRISTDNMGTGMTLDTVVQAQTSCASIGADAGTMGILGCNDDNGTAGSTRRLSSAFTTTAPAMMGQPVFIVVGGYLGSNRQPIMGNTAQGAFELSVTEISTVMPGGMCDPTGAANSCATGSRCFAPSGSMTGTCVADGALNGNCREGMTNRCDMGLQCSSATGSGTCRTVVMAGGMCNTTSTICAMGSTCVIPSGATMGTCVAAGTRGGSCRADAPRCDMGLECSSSGVCAQVVMAGAACDGRGIICASGSACVIPTGAAMGTCRAAGTAAGTACREAAPRCHMGLECSTMMGAGVCRANIAAGGACVPGSSSERCAMGTLCSPTSATAGTCAMPASGVTPGTMPMGAPVATMSRVYGGSVAAGARHCYAVTVPMGAGLFVQSGLAANRECSGAMSSDPLITVFNPAGTQIASFDDSTGFGLCSVGTPATSAALRGLAAGNYSVCIGGFSGSAVMGYLLSVGIVPAS